MSSVSLAVLLGLGFSQPVESCHSTINQVRELCNLYQYTTIDSLEQRHALQMVSHFGLLFSSQCSTFSKILVCSRFVLFCLPPDHFLQPCRELCQEIKASCIHLFEKLKTPWPAAVNCSTLRSSPNLCLSPSSQNTPVSLLPSATSSIDLPSVFSPPSPHSHLSYSSINPTASSMLLSSTSASSSMPATSSPLTVHLHSMPTATLQSTSQGLSILYCLQFLFYFCLWFCIHYHIISVRNTSHPLVARHHHTYSATAIPSPRNHAVFTITSATAFSSQKQGHSHVWKH